jgi:ribosome maturation factor RimP
MSQQSGHGSGQNNQTINRLRQMADEVALREGCYLYDLELTGGQAGRTLRVTIDKDVQGGASIEDCSNVSKGLNLLLDVEDIIPGGAYSLEVSTPGLERVLKEPRHFERAIGKLISVKTFQPLLQFNESLPELGKAKQVQGALLAFDEKGLKVDYQGKEVFVPFETVTKAHMVFEFVDPSEKKPGKGPKKGKAKN